MSFPQRMNTDPVQNQAPAAPEPDPPGAFLCPFTHDVFVDPVQDKEGNTYERACIELWLQSNRTSPITRNRLTVHDLSPNRALRNAIDEWRQTNGLAPVTAPVTAQVAAAPGGGVTRVCHAGDQALDLHLVIDTSGSMGREAKTDQEVNGERGQRYAYIDIARACIDAMARILEIHAEAPVNLGLSVFNTHHNPNVFSRKPLTSASRALLEERLAMGHLRPDGQTNLLAALTDAYTEAAAHWRPGPRGRIVVLTDGEPFPPGPGETLRRFRQWFDVFYKTRPDAAMPSLDFLAIGMNQIDDDILNQILRVVNRARFQRGLAPDGRFCYVASADVIGHVICSMATTLCVRQTAVQAVQRDSLLLDLSERFPMGRMYDFVEDVLRCTRPGRSGGGGFGRDTRGPITEEQLRTAQELARNHKAAHGADPWEPQFDLALASMHNLSRWGREYLQAVASMLRTGEPSMTPFLAPVANEAVRRWVSTEHGFCDVRTGEHVLLDSAVASVGGPGGHTEAEDRGIDRIDYYARFDALFARVQGTFETLRMPERSLIGGLNSRAPRMHVAGLDDDPYALTAAAAGVPQRANTLGDHLYTQTQGACFSARLFGRIPGEYDFRPIHSTQLRRGDVVMSGLDERPAEVEVRRVFLTPVGPSEGRSATPICKVGKMHVTEWHPVFCEEVRKWVAARDHPGSVRTTTAHMVETVGCGLVASVLLESGVTSVRVITKDFPEGADGNERGETESVAVLGHGSKETGLHHPFFGDAGLMERVAELVGETEDRPGQVFLDPARVEVLREGGRSDGDVVGMRVYQDATRAAYEDVVVCELD